MTEAPAQTQQQLSVGQIRLKRIASEIKMLKNLEKQHFQLSQSESPICGFSLHVSIR